MEKQLAELRSSIALRPPTTTTIVDSSATTSATSADEIEHCCEVLAGVEAQTRRLAKQFEKLEGSQKARLLLAQSNRLLVLQDERRRSLSKETIASLSADVANTMTELKVIRQRLEARKDGASRDVDRENLSSPIVCNNCEQKQMQIKTLIDETNHHKNKQKELTQQLLQTEERWTIKMEKQTSAFTQQV